MKKMKRMTALLLALVMLLGTLTACGGAMAKYAGTYVATQNDRSITLVLDKSGKAYITMYDGDHQDTGTWEIDGNKIVMNFSVFAEPQYANADGNTSSLAVWNGDNTSQTVTFIRQD